MSRVELLFFTDLDHTLLDPDYDWQAARSAIDRLRTLGVPLILNSSKTLAEIVTLRRALANPHPFVTENGAAVHIPWGYFTHGPRDTQEGEECFDRVNLGMERPAFLPVLHEIRTRRGFRFRGFADLTLEELAGLTGLSLDEAAAAAQRDGTEPILWQDSEPSEVLARELEPHGLRLVPGGRFLHVMGAADKGTATRRLIDRFRERPQAPWRTVALGDSANDFEMLRAVDLPVLMPRGDTAPRPSLDLPNLLRARVPGAAGWGQIVHQILDQHAAQG